VPELSRAQIAVYAALAVTALLLGARWIGSTEASGGPSGSISFAGEDRGGPEVSAVELTEGGEDLVVHVAGAVRDPGVYRLPDGSRVTDAIERAGGATGGGAPDAINLAAPLADGQQVTVPARVSSGSGPAAAGAAAAPDGPLSLGSATVEQLDTIDGIGPVTAASILEFRDERGGVASVDELDEISGIGPATMEALRARLQP
jgi:competence protein ComEA